MKRLPDYKRLLLACMIQGETVKDGNKMTVICAGWKIILDDRVMMGKDTTRHILFYKDEILQKDVITEFEIPNNLD